ncbi:hypothetical protein BASA81_002493 [Batrachochytrium salamandrivorans]|nr:hypothetical protein BASA81_002493 [Batrachochytrium salamandrivorans]
MASLAAVPASYELKLGSFSMMLFAEESSPSELQQLLTAKFSPDPLQQSAVAVQDVESGRIFPLDVVAARPDVLALVPKLVVLFSHTPVSALLRQLQIGGLLSEAEVGMLIPLCEDPFLLAAVDVFYEESDLLDLVDTLRRIVAIRVVSPARSVKVGLDSASPTRQPPSQLNESALQELEDELELAEFPRRELLELIDQVLASGEHVNDLVVLVQLVNKELPHLQAAYEVYALEQSIPNLKLTLKRIAKHYGIEPLVQGKPFGLDVLRAFRDGDVKVCGAWDVYVDDHNQEDFVDTLARIAKRWEHHPPSEEKQALRKMVLWLHAEMKVSGEEGHELMRIIDLGSATAERAMRHFTMEKTPQAQQLLIDTVLGLLDLEDDNNTHPDDEGDEEEEGEGFDEEDYEPLRQNLIEFLSDQVAKNSLSHQEKAVLLHLINRRDTRLLAAFDLFQEELDEEDLIDSLHHLCRHANKEVEEHEEEEEEEMGSVGFNLEELYELIAGKQWLSTPQLDVVHAALESQNQQLEQIISQFVETGEEALFQHALVEFCNEPKFDAPSLLLTVQALGLSNRDFELVKQAIAEQNGDVEMVMYEFVENSDLGQLKRDLIKFCRFTVDQSYDPDSILSLVSELQLDAEYERVIKLAIQACDSELELVLYNFVENEDFELLQRKLIEFVDLRAEQELNENAQTLLIDQLGLVAEMASLVKDALEAAHPDCQQILAKHQAEKGDVADLKQALELWAQTQI